MGYKVLARKWRPQKYADVVGQEHVLAALTNSCIKGHLHHAYLFSGSRGVGKTTIARIFAKGLSCLGGITATPCGRCSVCQEIEQGKFIDLIEVDAASRTKVEDTRELLDNVQYLPAYGRFKIYLIDEVHMLSRHSFNALLKTLEEPPPHVKFLLATTDPEKLPATILSRCLQLHLQLLNVDKIYSQLQKITNEEKINADTRALQLLARAANGSLRDALSLTDQAIATGNGEITLTIVHHMLGTLETQRAITLVEALHRADTDLLLREVAQAMEQGCHGEKILSEMLVTLHQIAMLQLLAKTTDEQHPGAIRLQKLSQLISPQDLQLYYQILLIGRKELYLVPEEQMGVEMTLLRALAFHPVHDVHVVQSKNSAASVNETSLSETVLQDKTTNHMFQNLDDELTTAQTLSINSTSPQALNSDIFAQSNQLIQQCQQMREYRQQLKRSKNKPSTSTSQQLSNTNTISEHTSIIQQSSQPTHNYHLTQLKNHPKSDQSKTVDPIIMLEATKHDNWCAEIMQLKLPQLVKQLALNSVKELISPQEICLHVRSTHSHLNTQKAKNDLIKALNSLYNKRFNISLVVSDDTSKRTPIEWCHIIYEKKLAVARQALLHDSKLQILQKMFAATLDEESISPF